MSALYLPVILGTARQGRVSEKVAHFVFDFVKTLPIETKLIDIRDYPQVRTEDPEADMSEWKKEAARADGFFLVTPEYNHGYPGELKMFFDAVFEECHYKPIAFSSVSSGVIGGARCVEQLNQVSIAFRMVPLKEAVYFAKAQDLFNEDGSAKDQETWQKRLAKQADELIWMAQSLKAPRLDRLAS